MNDSDIAINQTEYITAFEMATIDPTLKLNKCLGQISDSCSR